MAKQFPALLAEHRSFIARQPVFFVASAAADGRVNLSPKGLDPLRVIDERTVCYLDRTGSGAEVAAHLRADGRLTLMLCAFSGPPLILRLYGRGESLPRGGAAYGQLLAEVFGGAEPPGARQIVRLDIDLVQTSCGFGVPLMDFVGERPSLDRWAQAQGEAGLSDYRRAKNALSLDGLPTGLVD
ncbi:pyridoxamine 5'-phosphate oxidase family protein [Phenylobacterium sp.]|uniref:pyridoxamine 5'-phosphate oxidase family protein n=1 Tax=Phenylobacterium sp. TaxID=1871053 RepID=UPI0008C59AF2|nr:pyridoxamine 5'-phosphate oxidase family protein [Phenylobacterium sp.]MBA4795260.1 pyridoxamine 5'-phosphate oxidase family protein [Phenylobacterium sp.]OHB34976.1 MAG: pyridoxamine 5'-phosphate oxidase [Phenylobacterium sp. RIFCSPHIGHO2_01_FULL_70_10]